MIYACIVNNWPTAVGDIDLPLANHVFETIDDLEAFKAANIKFKPSTIYARIENEWVFEVREQPWDGSNHEFSCVAEFEAYCEAHADKKPVPSPENDALSEAEVWREKLAGGWTDPVTRIRLKTDEGARNLFSGQMTKAAYKVQNGKCDGSEITVIWDYEDRPHYMSINSLIELLVRYGDAWEQMFVQYAP